LDKQKALAQVEGKIMKATKLPNGDLLIPARAETDGVIGDGMIRISEGHSDYKKWLDFIEKKDKEA
jgi:hypothetical protein